MNLKISEITFTGKQEILYGLKQAAILSKSIQRANKAYDKQFLMSKDIKIKEETAAMRAYLDMVINDSEFVKTVNNGLTKSYVKSLKNVIKPEITEHGEVNPYVTLFKTTLEIAKKKTNLQDAIVALFSVLK